MKETTKLAIARPIRDFRMPRYREIPNMGLYLEQTTKYICETLAPLQEAAITGSMISNYVKKDLVDNPVRKLYFREQIAYLLFIALAKNVLSLDDLAAFISLQKRTYTPERAYDYLCEELENLLQYVFGLKEDVEDVGVDSTDEKFMLRATIVAVAHKIYLDKCFRAMARER